MITQKKTFISMKLDKKEQKQQARGSMIDI